MVIFTCNNCGDSLQKPKVEKHYQTSCRSFKNLTCVDCHKDFRGDEYVEHVKCLTEDERYSAKGSMAIGVASKGDLKQKSWMNIVNGIVRQPELPKHLKPILTTLTAYSNVPRKKAKFLNFFKSLPGRMDPRHGEEIWDLIEKQKNDEFDKKKKQELTKPVVENRDVPEESELNCAKEGKRKIKADTTEAPVECKKKKKSKNNNENLTIATTEEGNEKNHKFSFEGKVLEVLQVTNQVSLKKLQKKVLNAYVKHNGLDTFKEKHVKKFRKQLKGMSNIEIKDDVVLLT